MKRCSLLAVAAFLCAPWFAPLAFAQTEAPPFMLGADVSFLHQLEARGAVYKDQGEAGDLLQMFKAHGFNTIRLRLWHTPSAGVNGLQETLAVATRIREAGLDFLLDIHYSDTWADPARQTKPAPWQGLDFSTLTDSVRAYTERVIRAFKAQDTLPTVVQLGNEIIGGMLWDDGRVGGSFSSPTHWGRLATLLVAASEGLNAALDADDSVATMIHIDRGGDFSGARWFFDNLRSQRVDYDLIGLSFYPWWHGRLSDLEATTRILANVYNKPIVLVEMAYPWTLQWYDNTNNIVGLQSHVHPGYPATPVGQRDYVRDVIATLRAVPQGLGRGVFYWAPEYIAGTSLGSSWENVALFDNRGELLPAAEAFLEASLVGKESLPSALPRLKVEAFPNPFSATLTLRYDLSAAGPVRIDLYDLLGRRIAILADAALLPAGSHEITWKAGTMASGVYLCRISTAEGTTADTLLLKR